MPADDARATATGILASRGCSDDLAAEIVDHLIEADRCGVESHRIVRVLQYAAEFESGVMDPRAETTVNADAPNRLRLHARGGSGIPAMRRAVSDAARAARREGLAMATLTGAGHTGRLGLSPRPPPATDA